IPPTSFSDSKTRVWLALASMRIPSVSGRSELALKYLVVWGLPSSKIWKSSLVRLGIRPPLRSFTLKKTWTRSVRALKVAVGCSSGVVSWVDWLPSEPGGGWGRGGMGILGGCCPQANKTIVHTVRIRRLFRTLDVY